MPAGDLKERVAFDRIAAADTSYGIVQGGWDEQFEVAAGFTYLQGGEPVIAQRLQGVQPVVIAVRRSSDTLSITTEWRGRDARAGTIFNIRSIKPSKKRGYLDILVDSGVAV